MKSIILPAIYFLSLPLVIFSGEPLAFLVTTFVIGSLLFQLYKKNSLTTFALLLLLVLSLLLWLKPRLGIDMGALNAINSQRGEHQDFETNILPKLLHNKLDFFYSFIENITRLLSPAAIFASAFWHNISKYYPLGFLFPWDIYFIYRYLTSPKNHQKTSKLFFGIALSLLIILSGVVYLDQALYFTYSTVFFLAILAFEGYKTLSNKWLGLLVSLNISFILYHLWITPYFKP